ncbi:MAG: cation:proton antiporter [Thermoanaerobaculia bacterium]
MEVGQFLLTLIALFGFAKLLGELAERIGQPAVLGELLAGLVVGVSGLHLVDPHDATIHLLSELGVVLLLFLIGLETDLRKLLAVGFSSTAVALVGVFVPFGLGFLVGEMLGYPRVLSIFLGATLTATSVGITARVLSDLGHLQDKESQIVLGAAVIDDIVGLVILAVVGALAKGEPLSVLGVVRITVVAFGFVVLAIVIGQYLAPVLIRGIAKLRVAKALFFASVMFAFALAYLADAVGSAMIVGSFAAGLVLARTDEGHRIEREVHDIAQFFIPIFFVSVGAAIELKTLNPFDPAARKFLLIGIALTVVAIIGKIVAGFVVRGRDAKRLVIGVGMIPRGEVGLIFAQIGLATGLLSGGIYSAVALMVIATTFVTPPALRLLLKKGAPPSEEHVASYVTEAFDDRAPGAAEDE